MSESVTPVCSPIYAETHNLYDNFNNLPYCTFIHDSQAWEYNSLFSEWQDWAAFYGLNYDFTQLQSILFDRSDLAIIAAEKHMGVAMGRMRLIEPFLAEQKLVMPFRHCSYQCQQRYYALTPSINTPKVTSFVKWLKSEI